MEWLIGNEATVVLQLSARALGVVGLLVALAVVLLLVLRR